MNDTSIQDSKRFFDSLDAPLETTATEPENSPDTVQGSEDETGLSLGDALAILHLKQSPILGQILRGLQSQADGLESKAKDLKNLNPQRAFDRAEGLKGAIAVFASNFEDAVTRLRHASTEERLSLAGPDAQLFAQIVGKSAKVQVARPATIVKSNRPPDPTVSENTRRSIAQMESEKK